MHSHTPQCFIIVVVRWADAGHHECLGVPSQGRLEQSRELGVTVGDVLGFAVHQGRYDIAQGREGEVDFGCLFQSLSCESGNKISKFLC